jgi:hypothetical protein
MYTLLIRDEQGNMRVVCDWHGNDKPSLMGHEDCKAVAQKIRKAYPNATYGLEFGYYYTGDDWKGMSSTRLTDAFDSLPKFGRFLYTDETPEPDLPEQRVPLHRTAPRARLKEAVEQEVQESIQRDRSNVLFNCDCGWSGGLSDAADYDAEIPSCIDWTCPDCGVENVLVSGGGPNPPINAES